jgi:hypothetical protein
VTPLNRFKISQGGKAAPDAARASAMLHLSEECHRNLCSAMPV